MTIRVFNDHRGGSVSNIAQQMVNMIFIYFGMFTHFNYVELLSMKVLFSFRNTYNLFISL